MVRWVAPAVAWASSTALGVRALTAPMTTTALFPRGASWAEVGVAPELAAALASVGFEAPTPTQALAIPSIIGTKEDVIVHAPTGSGKTLAYLVPLLARIDAKRHTTQAVIFVPSRELGLQVAAIARKLTTAMYKAGLAKERLLIMSLLSGSKLRRQRAWAWAEPPHVIVGNAREIASMMETRGVKCADAIDYVVVDEVDAFVTSHSGREPADRHALHALLSDRFVADAFETDEDLAHSAAKQRDSRNAATRRDRQTVFASATIDQPRQFAKKLASMHWCAAGKTPLYLSEDGASASKIPATITHYSVHCPLPSKRLAVSRRILRDLATAKMSNATTTTTEGIGGIMVFVEASRPVEAIRAALDADAHKRGSGRVLAIDADDDLVSRARSLNEYTQGLADVLVVTDEASRGIDAPRTTHVINLDVPSDARAYAHRAGRTARLGRAGAVYTVVIPEESFVLRRQANSLHLSEVLEYDTRLPKPAEARRRQGTDDDDDDPGRGGRRRFR